jgi:hypothetical protein
VSQAVFLAILLLVWFEDWHDAAAWRPAGEPCWQVEDGLLAMDCQSAGLVTHQRWSRHFRVEVEVEVRAWSDFFDGDRYFAGIGPYNDDGGDWNYGSSALWSRMPPWQGVPGDWLALLVDEVVPPALAVPIVEGQAYTLRTAYRPEGVYEFWLDGVLVAERPGMLYDDPAIFLVCASVGEGTPDDGSLAHCEFGPVTVSGVPVEAVGRVYLPVAGDTMSGPVAKRDALAKRSLRPAR